MPAEPGPSERLALVLDRDGHECVWCRSALDPSLRRPTLEHVVPKLKGGPAWIENELAACRRCNRERGHRSPVDWLEECERRGWTPNRAAVERALRDLDRAIERRGGRRRARPYLAGQLRRLAKVR